MSTKVLLVDDEQEFVEILALRLKARGMTVSTATSVKEAFQKVEEESFDVVVLDLMMPEMDGLEALSILKMRNPDLPVIVYTGDITSERLRKAMQLGAFTVIPKVTDLMILTEIIENVMTGVSGDWKKSAKSQKDSEP